MMFLMFSIVFVTTNAMRMGFKEFESLRKSCSDPVGVMWEDVVFHRQKIPYNGQTYYGTKIIEWEAVEDAIDVLESDMRRYDMEKFKKEVDRLASGKPQDEAEKVLSLRERSAGFRNPDLVKKFKSVLRLCFEAAKRRDDELQREVSADDLCDFVYDDESIKDLGVAKSFRSWLDGFIISTDSDEETQTLISWKRVVHELNAPANKDNASDLETLRLTLSKYFDDYPAVPREMGEDQSPANGAAAALEQESFETRIVTVEEELQKALMQFFPPKVDVKKAPVSRSIAELLKSATRSHSDSSDQDDKLDLQKLLMALIEAMNETDCTAKDLIDVLNRLRNAKRITAESQIAIIEWLGRGPKKSKSESSRRRRLATSESDQRAALYRFANRRR